MQHSEMMSTLSGPHADRKRPPVVVSLFGLGTSPGAEFLGWARWIFMKRMGRLPALTAFVKHPVTAVTTCFQSPLPGLRAAVARTHKVGKVAQIVKCVWLRFRYGFPPEDYYRFHLYRPERMLHAERYLQHWASIVLFRHRAREWSGETEAFRDKRRFAEFCGEHGLSAIPVVPSSRTGVVAERMTNSRWCSPLAISS